MAKPNRFWQPKEKKCRCGCGETFMDSTRNLGKLCVDYRHCPSYREKSPGPVKGIIKRCICPCQEEFVDSSPGYVMKYKNKVACRTRFVKASKGKIDPVRHRPIKSNRKDKPFRDTICARKNVLINGRGGVLCDNYSACSDSLVTDGLFEYEKNGGVDCYVGPKGITNSHKSPMGAFL